MRDGTFIVTIFYFIFAFEIYKELMAFKIILHFKTHHSMIKNKCRNSNSHKGVH